MLQIVCYACDDRMECWQARGAGQQFSGLCESSTALPYLRSSACGVLLRQRCRQKNRSVSMAPVTVDNLPDRISPMCGVTTQSAHSRSSFRALALLLTAACMVCFSVELGYAADPLFEPPQPESAAASEVLMISTRTVGTSCSEEKLSAGLLCQRHEIDQQGRPYWNKIDWRSLKEPSGHDRTVIFVHGNRVRPGRDVVQGLRMFHSMSSASRGQRLRFIVWSWPSTEVPGLMKDVQIKAARTRPAGWQLAWFLDQLPTEVPVSLVGYSFGARVISGSLHLLGGGQLGNLTLARREHPDRAPMRVGMLAAAYDADWLQPGHYHGRAMSQVEQLVLVTNHRDPAMRLYHFSVERGRIHALGKHGIARPQMMGAANRRIRQIDVTSLVGRSHILEDYLSASGKMNAMWSRIVPRSEKSVNAALASQVGYLVQTPPGE